MLHARNHEGATDAPHPTDVHVGARVRRRRRMANITQGELARRLGLSFQAVQKYERGENRISASRLLEIAQILEVPVLYFFEGLAGATGAPAPVDNSWSDLTGAEIHKALSALGAIKSRRYRSSLLALLSAAAAAAKRTPGD